MFDEDLIILLWTGAAIVTVSIAMDRQRNPAIWLVASLASGPLACALLLLLPRGEEVAAIGLRPLSMDLCPACFEPIRKDARACRYCGTPEPFATAEPSGSVAARSGGGRHGWSVQ